MILIVIALALMLAVVGCGSERPTPQPTQILRESLVDRDCSDSSVPSGRPSVSTSPRADEGGIATGLMGTGTALPANCCRD